LDDCTWETLVKPGKKARVGARIIFGGGKLVGEVIDIVEEGNPEDIFTHPKEERTQTFLKRLLHADI
jgi:ABC-type polar amino acid transport system ATPase subunit